MGRPDEKTGMRSFEDKTLLVVVIAISLALVWILLPFYGAILWGLVGAIVFAPLFRLLSHAMGQRQGPIASTAASLMKLGITEMMFEAAMLRGDLAGAAAMVDGPDSYGLLAAPGGRIAGGTSQIQRNIIGERLLGLPR